MICNTTEEAVGQAVQHVLRGHKVILAVGGRFRFGDAFKEAAEQLNRETGDGTFVADAGSVKRVGKESDPVIRR